jgi:hypothetical protein
MNTLVRARSRMSLGFWTPGTAGLVSRRLATGMFWLTPGIFV